MASTLGRLVAEWLPEFLPRQRWFGAKGRPLAGVMLRDCGRLGERPTSPWLTLVEAAFATGPAELYAVPVVLRSDALEGGRLIGRLDTRPPLSAYDALDDPGACLALLVEFEAGLVLPTAGGGRVRFRRTATFRSTGDVAASHSSHRVTSEQSNTSVIYDTSLILKLFRKIEPGINPDAEVSGFLTTQSAYRHTPLLLGTLDYSGPDGLEATLAVLQRFVPNFGDGWTYVVEHLRRLDAFVREQAPASGLGREQRAQLVREFSADLLGALGRLGELTGGLHVALAAGPRESPFAPEPITERDVARWTAEIAGQIRPTLDTLGAQLDRLEEPARSWARRLLAGGGALSERVRDLEALVTHGCVKSRVHGDYHLGQTLRTEDGFVILDFEGEPARPLAERRTKHSPLRDVAGMLRSFDYAAAVVAGGGLEGESVAQVDHLGPWGEAWIALARAAFLDGYRAEAAGAAARLLPGSPAAVAKVLGVYELDKVLYELRYEMANRPTWVPVPLRGLSRLLG